MEQGDGTVWGMTASEDSHSELQPGQATSMHLQRALGGDRVSLDWLVERLDPLLQAQAAYRMGPLQHRLCDPRDIVHEAWLVLLPRLSSLPPRDGRMTPVLLSFLSTTITNKLNNLLRSELRRGGRDESQECEPAMRDEVSYEVTRREAQQQVREAISELTSQDREILILRGIEQQSGEETAESLGLTRHAVHKRYGRALERLRTRLPGSVFAELVEDDR